MKCGRGGLLRAEVSRRSAGVRSAPGEAGGRSGLAETLDLVRPRVPALAVPVSANAGGDAGLELWYRVGAASSRPNRVGSCCGPADPAGRAGRSVGTGARAAPLPLHRPSKPSS